ncbi:hypothetical protein CJF42_11280 [Pseudoalteromonas sp. NBT06-2]|uniref:glycosyltransferase family 9 protein n=1 Tax=Pseudoalteromonas sp. NBT06-2 TaxID=2025950 RepID=UPI000BA6B30B|nr:glycosyltransferase family 9 protein [Pseudoalteromonas sp. NBT06-2]PAJ74271.1 hypothetical protein CJF42_11280 [Pseudoalteromonas sp. NBT06-2]
MSQLISKAQLKQANRILYMTHLAIGDFVYQGAFLKEFKEQNPHVELDIWIDDSRTKPKAWHADRNTTLCQWLNDESYINQVYPIVKTNSERNHFIKKAHNKNYDLIFFIATTRSESYAKIARKISCTATITGIKSAPLKSPLKSWWHFRALDSFYFENSKQLQNHNHITNLYQARFKKLIGLEVAENKRALKILPEKKYLLSAQYILSELKNKYDLVDTKTIFINHLSTTIKRDYQWIQVKELLIKLSSINNKLSFIINSPPSLLENIEKQINDDEQLNKLPIKTFSAMAHFFELPAMIKCCDYVISVETAIMHLASSVGTPQIALIRESARHWRPLGKSTVLFGKGRVDMISPNQITDAFEELTQKEVFNEPSI